MKLPVTLSYSVRRIALFVATLLLAAVAMPGADPILVLLVATIVSGLLSFWILAGPRKEMARKVEARMKGIGSRLDAGARREDALLDAQEAAARAAAGQAGAGKVQQASGAAGNSRESGEDTTGRA